MEHTEITCEEYLRLCQMELDTKVPLSRLLIPFTIIKQNLIIQEYLERVNENLVGDLIRSLVERRPPPPPADDRVAALGAENEQLRAKATQAERDAVSASSRERGMTAELAGAGKRLRELKNSLPVRQHLQGAAYEWL